jgi:dinuclear metal center YbgI/SA1388 family protein
VTLLRELVSEFDAQWPVGSAEAWDRCGLILGDLNRKVSRVLFSVDLTQDLIEEAIADKYDLVISHHPLLLRTVDTLVEDAVKTRILEMASQGGVAIYAAHTNADITFTGVCATLADSIGIDSQVAFEPAGQNTGHGRVGYLPQPTSLLEFARKLARVLPATAGGVKVAGDPNLQVSKVAVLAGAGDSFLATAYQTGADVYVTSDLRHHPTQDARELAQVDGRGFALIDISHWAAESLWLAVAAASLSARFAEVTFDVSDLRTDPWDFLVTQ